MHLSVRTGIVTLLLALVFFASSAQSASYYPFYPHTYRITTKRAFIRALTHSRLIDQAALVHLYNQEEAGIAPHVDDFDDLLNFLESDVVTVQPCHWNPRDPRVYIFAVDASGKRFHKERRACKAGELVLRYKGHTLFSLYCGNLVHDPRERVVPRPLPRRSCLCDSPLIHTSTYNLDTGAWQAGWSAEDTTCN